jgi:hypothetical protein
VKNSGSTLRRIDHHPSTQLKFAMQTVCMVPNSIRGVWDLLLGKLNRHKQIAVLCKWTARACDSRGGVILLSARKVIDKSAHA